MDLMQEPLAQSPVLRAIPKAKTDKLVEEVPRLYFRMGNAKGTHLRGSSCRRKRMLMQGPCVQLVIELNVGGKKVPECHSWLVQQHVGITACVKVCHLDAGWCNNFVGATSYQKIFSHLC